MQQIQQTQQILLTMREDTPEPVVIPSQYRLQQVLETENPFLNIPAYVIEYYKKQGLIIVSEEGELILATPYKEQPPKKST